MTQCSANSKRTGERCRDKAMRGHSVCYHHGGATPRGFANPNTKHGKYSKFLPDSLAKNYNKALHDPDLLALRDAIALFESRLLDVLKRVNAGESGRLWKMLQAAYNAMLEARAQNDGAQVAARLNDIGSLIQRGIADYAAWGEVREVVEQGRKLRETEHKRLVAMQMMVSKEEQMNLVAALVSMVRRHISDRDTLAAISTDLIGILNHESGARLVTGDDGGTD